MPNRKSKSAPKSAQKPGSANLTWLPNKTFELELTIPQDKVKKAYQEVLAQLAKTTQVKGFRQGKAPLKLVEEQVGKQQIYDHVIQHVITDQYLAALKQHQLAPIVSPKIEVVNIEEDKDWVVKATACETPEINLGDWEKAVKGVAAVSKIWTPDQGKPAVTPKAQEEPKTATEQTAEPSQQEKLTKIFDALLKEAQVKLADRLIEEETNRMLSRLLDQVNRLGLTIDQYIASQNLTVETLRQEYQKTAERTLALEFILAKIALEKNLTSSEKDIEAMIQAVPDEKERQKLQSPDQKAYIASILRKRKTIDYLLSL
jgi:FKBP-type peptidyl-prolyl cis-trans isomerase (trigger factor)